MPHRKAAAVQLVTIDPSPSASADVVRLIGWDPAKGLQVRYSDGRTAFAETTLNLDRVAWQQAIGKNERVLAVTTASGSVVVTGIVRSLGAVQPTAGQEIDVHVDGDRLVFQGRQEIELKCGQASIVLRRNGEVLIRGNSLVSRSRGKNVITGATIRLN